AWRPAPAWDARMLGAGGLDVNAARATDRKGRSPASCRSWARARRPEGRVFPVDAGSEDAFAGAGQPCASRGWWGVSKEPVGQPGRKSAMSFWVELRKRKVVQVAI